MGGFFQNVESIHEETRVERGPIRLVRPEEWSRAPGRSAPKREPRCVTWVQSLTRWACPGVNTKGDRVSIEYGRGTYLEDPQRAAPIKWQNQRLKILSVSWFYGGKEPADSPFLCRP